ncbi:hypothetical protein [Neorhizobium sp. T6_25]|uniref:hypothetical protein n=1 Tax=Neorhizobium sp. T6_25 TaxID=2093833 RepID=UPI000CFA2B46|nr:hypothetical protein [Neorhizobium sp. T6_25]
MMAVRGATLETMAAKSRPVRDTGMSTSVIIVEQRIPVYGSDSFRDAAGLDDAITLLDEGIDQHQSDEDVIFGDRVPGCGVA